MFCLRDGWSFLMVLSKLQDGYNENIWDLINMIFRNIIMSLFPHSVSLSTSPSLSFTLSLISHFSVSLTWLQSWANMVQQTEHLSKIMKSHAEELNSGPLHRLTMMIKDKQQVKKSYQTVHQQIESELCKVMSMTPLLLHLKVTFFWSKSVAQQSWNVTLVWMVWKADQREGLPVQRGPKRFVFCSCERSHTMTSLSTGLAFQFIYMCFTYGNILKGCFRLLFGSL